MKKVTLSDGQMEQVVKLRGSGLNWSKVQEKTGIPRRIAKREYEESQKKISQKQLDLVRKEVVAQEYQAHLDLLAQFAISLVDVLGIPEAIADLRSADEVMTNLISKDNYKEHEFLGIRFGDHQRERRVVSMNTLLFKSLRAHTLGKVHWEMLDEWKAARDSCIDKLDVIRKELGTVLENILRQRPQLKKMLDATKRTDVLTHIVDDILANIWLSEVLGDVGGVTASRGASLLNKGTAWIDFHKKAPEHTRLTFSSGDRKNNEDLAKGIAEVSNQAIYTIRTLEFISKVKSEVDRMQNTANELETTLNPLVLRPLILHSRCDICPI